MEGIFQDKEFVIHLFQLVRQSIEFSLQGKDIGLIKIKGIKIEPFGVFVTIKKHGYLRGCIGTFKRDLLENMVKEASILSAFHDPRFLPVDATELDHLEFEITVLKPFEKVESIDEIEIGKHGILIERGGKRGLLLPQVALENNWNLLDFLKHTCLKAGLTEDCFLDSDTKIFKFEAFVLREK